MRKASPGKFLRIVAQSEIAQEGVILLVILAAILAVGQAVIEYGARALLVVHR